MPEWGIRRFSETKMKCILSCLLILASLCAYTQDDNKISTKTIASDTEGYKTEDQRIKEVLSLRWIPLNNTKNAEQHYISEKSTKHYQEGERSITRVWILQKNATTTKQPQNLKNGTALLLLDMDFDSREIRVIESHAINNNGEILKFKPHNIPSWQKIEDGTTGYYWLEAAKSRYGRIPNIANSVMDMASDTNETKYKWDAIGHTKNSDFYLHYKLDRKTPTLIASWVKVFSKELTLLGKTYSNVQKEELIEIKCGTSEFRITSFIIYDQWGNVLIFDDGEKSDDIFQKEEPGSIMSDIISKICEKFRMYI